MTSLPIASRARCRASYQWPPHEGADAELARGLVRDLARDPRLLELLATELARAAERQWGAR